MKLNIKSRKGFTLIELLVVIGILAVLAAIAIPSVAGLIDRANVSSDKTNANEMTNAIERFTSEYELYCQDIASGVIKQGQTTGFDSAQGRVYNVTKVTDRAGIERLEKASSANENTTGRAIYRDTKYPVNAETTKAIIENYTKTSSSTFEPKQSDKHFWYSPECGVVIVADANSSVKDKNDMIISGMDAKGNLLNENTIWINLTTPITNLPALEIPDNAFFVKPENTFAISNYYEIMSSCPHFQEEGGLAQHCISIFESQGRSIYSFMTWSDLLSFCYEHLNDEFYNHQHGKLFAYSFSYTDGMTWTDFINSSENNGKFAIDKSGNIYCAMTGDSYGCIIANNEGYIIKPSDAIDSDTFYFISFGSADID